MKHQGKYRVKNRVKYKGDYRNVFYRSSWEKKMMIYLDNHPDVVEWGSEEVVIPYRSPIDGRYHRYFPDFILTRINREGRKETLLVEVKPYKQTKEPKVQKKATKKYLYEVKTWGINQAKWNAANEFAKNKGWKFVIFTENELGV